MRAAADASAMETWNPVTGCVKISGGCQSCYAERISHRYGTTSLPWNRANAETNVVLHPDRLEAPLHWRKPRRVFAGSMTDLFGEAVPDAYIGEILAVIALAANARFMVITKRAERMAGLLGAESFWDLVRAAVVARAGTDEPIRDISGTRVIPNLTLRVTIGSNMFPGRADALRATPAARRIAAAEPLLTALPALDLAGIDAITVGGESGGRPERRLVQPCAGALWEPKPEALAWVRDLRDRAAAAGVAFSLHQWGGPYPGARGRSLDGRTYELDPWGDAGEPASAEG